MAIKLLWLSNKVLRPLCKASINCAHLTEASEKWSSSGKCGVQSFRPHYRLTQGTALQFHSLCHFCSAQGVPACRSLLGPGLCPAGVPRPSATPCWAWTWGGGSAQTQIPWRRWGSGSLTTAVHPAHPQHMCDFNGFHQKPPMHVLGAWFRGEHDSAALDSVILESFSNPNQFMILQRDLCFHYLMVRELKPGISNSPLERFKR